MRPIKLSSLHCLGLSNLQILQRGFQKSSQNVWKKSTYLAAQKLASLKNMEPGSWVIWGLLAMATFLVAANGHSLEVAFNPEQPLSRMQLHRQLTAMNSAVIISASPDVLGANAESSGWVTVTFSKTKGAAATDFIAVFSPANFDGKQCTDANNTEVQAPAICNAPIKFEYANFTSTDYVKKGYGTIKFLLINQRADFAFGFFSGDLANPVLEGISNIVKFKNPKAPQWPRLALGKEWDEMTVTWTSGYSEKEARPIIVWKWEDESDWKTSLAITLTYEKSDMCGAPASTVGWRHPGYIHTAFLKELGPGAKYHYKVGHKLKDGKYVWGEENFFTSAPYPGQNTLQRLIIFGDMGKRQRDGTMEINNNQPGALNTTDALVKDINNYDVVFHNGDLVYANGYLSEWDQFSDQISNITKRVPYMVSVGNHERDYPGSSSFYQGVDSGGECGVPTSTTFHMPAENPDKHWYAASWGKFKFCIANSEMDWRIGSEQYKFLEHCMASTDRQKQPWLIFLGHRVLGYTSAVGYQTLGSFGEPMACENLQTLWQKYKVDLSIYGHVHNYERTCTVYQNSCVGDEKDNYSGQFNATIHIVVGTGGRGTEGYGPVNTTWSLVKDESLEYGYLKLTSEDHQNLLVEFIHSNTGFIADKFTINRKFMDVLGCDKSKAPICPSVTSADA